MPFEFATATRILFGAGRVTELTRAVEGFGDRVLWVTGANPQRHAALAESLRAAGITPIPHRVAGEPSVQDVIAGVDRARSERCLWVASCGGGSVIDAGKAIAALATNRQPVMDYLEIVGRGLPLTESPLPFVALPTTAGTGAEVTRNSVLSVPEKRVKVSLRSPRMLPTLAVVDSELTLELPRSLTATTGLDALTQLIEPFVSVRANPVTDAVCREGIRRFAHAFPRVLIDGSDRAAREEMALASLLGGLALANAGLGAVHGFAGPIGGMYPAPHGAICAALLAPVCESNWSRLRREAADSVLTGRFDEIAQMLTGDSSAGAEEGFHWIRNQVAKASVPGLSRWGIRETEFPEICAKATVAGSMKGNPVVFSPGELAELLTEAL